MNLLSQAGLVFSVGETVLFWIVAPLVVLGASSLLFARRPVRIAVAMAGVLIGIAVLYIMLEAPFLGVTQIVVYTGAIMMLFLFVIMLVGVDAAESRTETITGQRWIAWLAGAGLVILLIGIASRAVFPDPVGLAQANADTNAVGVARLIFGDYVLAFELTGALLITAAVGAIILAHSPRVEPKVGQAELATQRLKEFAAGTGTVTPRPGPGVYARHNASDMPALDAQGDPIEESITTVLRIRGQAGQVDPEQISQIEETADGAQTKEVEG